MDKVVTYNLDEDLIQNLADFVEKNFLKKTNVLKPHFIVVGIVWQNTSILLLGYQVLLAIISRVVNAQH